MEIDILIKLAKSFFIEASKEDTMKQGNGIVTIISKHIDEIKEKMIILEGLVANIKKKISNTDYNENSYVKLGKNGMLVYDRKQPNYYKIDQVPFGLSMPTVNNLDEIPPSLYYLNDVADVRKNGVYINIAGNYIKIPFPEVVNPADNLRDRTMRCRNVTIDNCRIAKKGLKCSFAHKGETIVKVGSFNRCQIVPNIGNKTTFIDVKKLASGDVKIILLYGLNDLFTAFVYFSASKCNKLIIDPSIV